MALKRADRFPHLLDVLIGRQSAAERAQAKVGQSGVSPALNPVAPFGFARDPPRPRLPPLPIVSGSLPASTAAASMSAFTAGYSSGEQSANQPSA